MKNKYIVAIDYSANYKPMTIDYKVLEADNLLDAMSEAESYLDTEKVYLLNIMQADKADHKVRGLPGLKKNMAAELAAAKAKCEMLQIMYESLLNRVLAGKAG